MEIAPAAELAPEHRELAEIAAESEESERPDVADVLPVDRFRELLELVPENALVAVSAEEELAPALRDYWEDVTTSFHDDDAHHLYVKPDRLDEALAGHARRCVLSSISQDQPYEFRRRPPTARHARSRTPSLSSRSSCARATAPSWPGRAAARRSGPSSTWLACGPPSSTGSRPLPRRSVTFAHASLRDGFIAPQLKLAVLPEHRLLRRRRARAAERARGGRDRRRSPTFAPAPRWWGI